MSAMLVGWLYGWHCCSVGLPFWSRQKCLELKNILGHSVSQEDESQ